MLACIFRALPITTLSKYTIIFLYTYKKIPEIVQMLSLSTRDVSRRDYGPPQIKCRLLISRIFDAMNF